MNQKGRDFLSKKVEEVYKREVELLEQPDEPKLEKMLSAAILNGEDIFLDKETVQLNLKKAIAEDSVEFEQDRGYWRRGIRLEAESAIKLNPWLIMSMPKDFAEAMSVYNEKVSRYKEKMKTLDEQKELLLMKIQIGSDKMLAPLVDQADSLGNLQLMNSRLIVTEQPKQLN